MHVYMMPIIFFLFLNSWFFSILLWVINYIG